MQRLIREFLRYSYKKKSNKKRKLVLRMWQVRDWDHEIEAAGRFAVGIVGGVLDENYNREFFTGC